MGTLKFKQSVNLYRLEQNDVTISNKSATLFSINTSLIQRIFSKENQMWKNIDKNYDEEY